MFQQFSNTFGLVKYIFDGGIQKRKVLRFFCGSVYFCCVSIIVVVTGLDSTVGRVSTLRSGGTAFGPGLEIPKSLTIVLVAPHLAIRFWG